MRGIMNKQKSSLRELLLNNTYCLNNPSVHSDSSTSAFRAKLAEESGGSVSNNSTGE